MPTTTSAIGVAVAYLGVGVGVARNEMDDGLVMPRPISNRGMRPGRWPGHLWPAPGFRWGNGFFDWGRAQSGTADSSGFANNPPLHVDDLTAHEFKVGL